MKRRIAIAVVLLVVIGVGSAFAQMSGRSNRLGLAVGTPNGINGVLVYRPAPFDIKASYDFTVGNQYIFLAGDIRLIDNRQIAGVLHGSFGIGVFGKLYPEGRDDDDDSIDYDAGTRVPFALSILLLEDFLELFIEVAPSLDFYPKLRFANQPVQVFAGATIQLD